MDTLFSPTNIGSLALPNRLVRSATAERMADASGRPRPQLKQLYQELARGGVGLIITGHMYVHPSGRAHPEMTGIYSDELIPSLAELANAVHQEGGRVAVQINHGGMQCSPEAVPETMAPSTIDASFLQRPAREMTPDEIALLIQAYAQAACRAQEAGFDGVQIHGAHGYLISQFLSPLVNRRTDEWGGPESVKGRMNFLRAVCQAVRKQVGPDYPVFIKLGVMDGVEGGLTVTEGMQVVAVLEEMGLDAVEISGGIGGGRDLNTRVGIRSESDEAYFGPLAQQARPATELPIILVGGFRSRRVMEEVLATGDADLISLCRPLICEPDLPNRLRLGLQERSACLSANRCWPEKMGEGIACKCSVETKTRHQRLPDEARRQKGESSMLSRTEIEKALAEWNQAWNKYDLDEVMKLFHDEVLFENWTGGRVKGKEALRQAWAPWFANHGGFRFTEQETFIDEAEQKVLYRWLLEWPSFEKGYEGRPERRWGVDVLHFQDKKIIRKLTYSKTTVEIDGQRVRLAASGK